MPMLHYEFLRHNSVSGKALAEASAFLSVWEHHIRVVFFLIMIVCFAAIIPGYETDERSSLGKRGECRRGREERPERSAAVYIFKAAVTAAENIGHRKPGRYAELISANARHKDKYKSCRPNQKTTAFAMVFLCFLNFLK